MSRENVEIFRRGTDALERSLEQGEFDAALVEELVDPDHGKRPTVVERFA
jgi:hypothetical protein